MTFKDKLMAYLFTKQNRIENDYENIVYSVRFSRNDEVDYLECIIAKVRKDLIKEIIGDIMLLLNVPRK